MNKLLLLSESLIERVAASTVGSATPISVRKKDAPIAALEAWENVGGFLKKTYMFDDFSERNSFLYQLLAYEQEKKHAATIVVKKKEVTIRIITTRVNKVTELDKEYSHVADTIYQEIKELATKRESSINEFIFR